MRITNNISSYKTTVAHSSIGILIAVFSMITINGCTTAASTTQTPAIRININQDGQRELQQVIATSLHLPNVYISNNALSQKSTIIIERNKSMGLDLSKPTVFKLLKTNGQCLLENQNTKIQYRLLKTQCTSR